jgi:hypothetical protein
MFDFTCLSVPSCEENATRRFRSDCVPVPIKIARGPAEIVKLGSTPVRFTFVRVRRFRFVRLAVNEQQDLCAHFRSHSNCFIKGVLFRPVEHEGSSGMDQPGHRCPSRGKPDREQGCTGAMIARRRGRMRLVVAHRPLSR